MRQLLLPLLVLFLLAPAAQARGVYQSDTDFINEVFDGQPPPSAVIWLTGELRQQATEILGHPPGQLRLRYWARGTRSAWILEEIGKEKPITVGIVIDDGRISRVKVLAFRESRGWEVRHPFFTRQYQGAGLDERDRLDRAIDGISGATLSVRALNKLARLALFLDRQRRQQAQTGS